RTLPRTLTRTLPRLPGQLLLLGQPTRVSDRPSVTKLRRPCASVAAGSTACCGSPTASAPARPTLKDRSPAPSTEESLDRLGPGARRRCLVLLRAAPLGSAELWGLLDRRG